MFAALFEVVNTWFETAERRRREAFLAESKDIIELEQRIRTLETAGF